jgi:hypothetical protein
MATGESTATSNARARRILLIRHAEKPAASGGGVTAAGEPSDKSLSVRGWQRAGALVPFLTRADAPGHLFALHSSSDRPRETLVPLAEKLGIAINADFGKGDEGLLAAAAKACEGVVLISWQHDYMSAVANAILEDRTTAPQEWPKDCFDVIWVFELDEAARAYRFGQMPQRLLAGDER